MKKTLFSLLLILLVSCGVSDDRIDAYEECIPAVEKAASSQELLGITYELSKQMQVLEVHNTSVAELEKLAAAGDEDARERYEAIEAARKSFMDAVSKKESSFYVSDKQK